MEAANEYFPCGGEISSTKTACISQGRGVFRSGDRGLRCRSGRWPGSGQARPISGRRGGFSGCGKARRQNFFRRAKSRSASRRPGGIRCFPRAAGGEAPLNQGLATRRLFPGPARPCPFGRFRLVLNLAGHLLMGESNRWGQSAARPDKSIKPGLIGPMRRELCERL